MGGWWFGETVGGAFLLIPWLICIKYPKQITLSDTNTVMLIIVIIIVFTCVCPTKKLSGITNQNKIQLAGWQNSEIVG